MLGMLLSFIALNQIYKGNKKGDARRPLFY